MTTYAERPTTTLKAPMPAAKGKSFVKWITSTDHKTIGYLYLMTSFAWFLIAGVLALVLRAELARPGMQFLSNEQYNQIFTMHGTIMLLMFATPLFVGFANVIMPLQIGAADVAFPRLNMLSYWLYLFGGTMAFVGFLTPGGAASFGWTAYAPLSNAQYSPGIGGDLWLVGLAIGGLGTILGGVNFVTTILTMRAPGMTMFRMSIFSWNVLLTSILVLIAFPPLAAAFLALESDRAFGSHIFDPANGGAMLWQHLFWFFGHPEVYILILPGFGMISHIISTFSKKPVFGYLGMAYAMVAIGIVGFVVWAHHMYISGWAPLLNAPFMLTTELISIPTGMLFLVLVGTLWRGRLWMTMPTMSIFALLWNFMIGGITGIYLSDVPADAFLHGSMYVTAHFHYTLMGAGLTGALAALVYWFPKMTGRMFDKKLSWISFWLVQIGFNVAFVGMFTVGLAGQPRRVESYASTFNTGNLITTIGAYTIMVGMLVLLHGVISSWRSGDKAPMNPWQAKTLEWTVPNPIPLENFDVLPTVTSDAYGYGKAKS